MSDGLIKVLRQKFGLFKYNGFSDIWRNNDNDKLYYLFLVQTSESRGLKGFSFCFANSFQYPIKTNFFTNLDLKRLYEENASEISVDSRNIDPFGNKGINFRHLHPYCTIKFPSSIADYDVRKYLLKTIEGYNRVVGFLPEENFEDE